MASLIGFIEKFGGKRMYFLKLSHIRVEGRITFWCRNKTSCFLLNDSTLFEKAVSIKNDNKSSIVDHADYVQIHGLDGDGLAMLTIEGDEVVEIQGIDIDGLSTRLKKLAEGNIFNAAVDNDFLALLKKG